MLEQIWCLPVVVVHIKQTILLEPVPAKRVAQNNMY